MLSWPRKIRSKVVPLKGSIQEPNLPSKNLLQPSINRTRHNLNPTWGSGGISSICRVPVSSTFWQKTSQLRQVDHLSSLWLGREDETSLSCSFTAIELKYLPPGENIQSTKKRPHEMRSCELTWDQTVEAPSPLEPLPWRQSSMASPP